MLLAYRPELGHQDKDQRIHNNRVGNGKEALCARGIDQARHGDERVGRVKVSAQQKPCHDSAEASSGQTPLINRVEVTSPPASCHEAENRYEKKKENEDGQCYPINHR